MSNDLRSALTVGVILSVCLSNVAFGLFNPIIVSSVTEAGHSPSQIGILVGIWAVPILILTPIYQRIIGQIGLFPSLAYSLASTAIALACFALTSNFYIWLVFQAISGAAFGASWVATEAAVNELAPDTWRGRLIAIYGVGPSIGAFLGSLLPNYVGLTGVGPIFLCASIMALSLVPAYGASKVRLDASDVAQPTSKGLLKAKPMIPVLALFAGIFDTLPWAILPMYAIALGLGAQMGVELLNAFFLGHLLFAYPMGLLLERRSMMPAFLVAIVGTLFACLALMLTQGSPWPQWIAVLAAGGTIGTFNGIGLVLLGRSFEGITLIGANASYVRITNIGSILGPYCIGVAIEKTGVETFPIIMIALIAFLPLIWIISSQFAKKLDQPVRSGR